MTCHLRLARGRGLQRMGLALGKITHLLAEMQTSINAAGMRSFDGDVDRFAIFSLIVRESLQRSSRDKAISTHSLAISLSRSFETVRRHVIALTEQGLCVRGRGGVMVRPEVLEQPDVAELMRLSHDSFVRFVEALARSGELPSQRPPARPYDRHVGIAAAVDVMLATADSNRAVHRNWLDLVLFSTVLAANLQRRGDAGVPVGPDHAVRPGVLSRVLNLPETTVRRRLKLLIAGGGPLVRVRDGYLVSRGWLERPEAAETQERTYAHIRLIVANAAAQGFPIDDPASVYLDGRPSVVSLV
ncbi:hypothetical protein M9979_02645 [Sphingomonas sp. RP10(2022)]|uniref:Uncharacterized protein n=1 Tax=Sphingomonas liriopis TaxID=2949094 RepID=A0A9X2KPD2_9SPHN|nr:hypothetical protein [Sphingomonas liriopis]MCP3733780.1 hypothetical protein [Sphingomonas liriopis]